jgi:farnesyl diphosphate synthase
VAQRLDAGPSASGAAELGAWLEEARAWCELALERELARRAQEQPERLAEALRYALLSGGKRLRPALARLVCEELGGSPAAVEPAAVALEAIHTYSLVHDDLPCMDDDDLRRGRPTCHVVYGEALAVLVGDALQALAFEVLAAPHAAASADSRADALHVLAHASGAAGMVGGQVHDLEGASRGASLEQRLERVRATHRMKTAALFAAAAELGAIAAGAALPARRAAHAYGAALGACFQAVDDCLDETGDAATLGKTPGKDRELERDSLVAVLGLAGARAEAQAAAERARQAAAALVGSDAPRLLALVDRLLARRA